MPNNNHTTNSWEQLLKEQADQFKMYPFDDTWRRRTVRSARRIPSFTAITVFLTMFFAIRPLTSRHIARQENPDKDMHVSIGDSAKKINPVVPRG